MERRRTTSCVRSSGFHGEADPSVTTSVWRGSDVLVSQQGMKSAWDSFRPPCIRANALGENVRGAQTLLDRIPMVSDLHEYCCCIARLRELITSPGWLSLKLPKTFVGGAGLWRCFCTCMRPITGCDTATMPLVLGGLGLRSAIRGSAPACWARWADCLSMIHKRHFTASAALVRALEGQPNTPFLKAVSQCQRELTGRMDFVPPSWGIWHGVLCRLRESLKTENQEPHTADGNTKPACELKVSSERNCSHALRPRSRH